MNFLFIGGESEYIDANSVCIRNMTNELINKGHNVCILAMGKGKRECKRGLNGALLVEYPMDFFHRLTLLYNHNRNRLILSLFYRFISLIRHFLLLFCYPNTSPIRARNLSKRASQIVIEQQISIAVCIFCPYDNIYAGLYLKKHFGDRIRVVSYHLDLRTGSASQSKSVRAYIHKHALASLVREFSIVDRVLIPYSGKSDIERLNYSNKDKLYFVGFPVFVNELTRVKCSLPFDNNVVNISYIGTLYPGNRDPHYFLSLCDDVSKRVRLKLHFWGIIDAFRPLIDSYDFAEYHGVVDNSCVRYIMDNTDFLLNIGNKLAFEMLPSKVFGMFATGKPIINMVTHPNDASIPYFLKYPNAININEYDKNINDSARVENFIRSAKSINTDGIKVQFTDFMPETICELLFP